MKSGPKPIPILERMEKFVIRDPNSGCWLWSGALTYNGYGRIGFPGKPSGGVYTHRITYELYVGDIPKGMEIDHKCRVRSCVNPLHLEVVSHAENMRRRELHREVRIVCNKGHSLSDGGAYPSETKRRFCKQCNRENSLKWRIRERELANAEI